LILRREIEQFTASLGSDIITIRMVMRRGPLRKKLGDWSSSLFKSSISSCEAIEYGSRTIGRRRYHNTAIKVEDIINGHEQEIL